MKLVWVIFFTILAMFLFPQNVYSQSMEGMPLEPIIIAKVGYHSKLITSINDSIQKLPDDAFVDPKKAAEFRLNFSKVLMEGNDSVNELIIRTNHFEYPIKENFLNRDESVSKLFEVSKRMDGSLGGNSDDDWITDPHAQKQILSRIGFVVFEFTDPYGQFILNAKNIQGDSYTIWGFSEHVIPSTFTVIPNKSILIDIWGEGKTHFNLPHNLIKEIHSIKADEQTIEFESSSGDSLSMIAFNMPPNKTLIEITGIGIPSESFDGTQKISDHKCQNQEIKPSSNEKPLDVIWFGPSHQKHTTCDAVVHLQSLNLNVEKRERPFDNLDDAKLVVIKLKSNTDQFTGNVKEKLSNYVTNGGHLIILDDRSFRNCDWYPERCQDITDNFGFRFGSLNPVSQMPFIGEFHQSDHPIWNKPNQLTLDIDWCCQEFVEVNLVDKKARILGEIDKPIYGSGFFDSDICCDSSALFVLNDNASMNVGKVIGIDYNLFVGNFGNFGLLENIVYFMLNESDERQESWILNTSRLWSEGRANDSDFISGIQYLIKDGILEMPDCDECAIQQVPTWLKNNAGWWADGFISDEDYLNGIQFLLDNRIIVV